MRGDVRLKLGDAYAKTGDANGALREHTRAADLLPKSADAQIKAGSYLLSGAHEDARRGRARAGDRPEEHDGGDPPRKCARRPQGFDGRFDLRGRNRIDPAKYQAYVSLGIQYAG